ncbi:unnamed protein product [Bursaphelenchus okinawaensis]|uniref:Nudix hydrolase domain-containing protein n=1 Tax=Bursaphelenchus okinawaensis TaxID=465554 RepID=A0A811K290_9BILA|nr:unnamed protein product [Bursaphelenchus okinawaensis]CAG9090053.1 unnamed protein product [Bursaphelenchus okinawaensis]
MFPTAQFAMSLLKYQRAASVALLNSEIRHVLMVKRPKNVILPEATVFPGGKFDHNKENEFPREKTNWNLVEEQPIQPLDVTDDYCYRVAALRELFVQTGTLLIYSVNCRESIFVTSKDDSALHEWKDKVKQDPTKFNELFNKTDKLDVNVLVPWSNWLTPQGCLERLEKIFFLAPIENLDADQFEEDETLHWLHSTDFIEQNSVGKMAVPIPQFYELMRIRLSHQSHLHSQISTRQVVPQLIQTEDRKIGAFVFPEDHLYLSDEAEFQSARTMKESDIIPKKEIDQLRTIHRILYREGFLHNELFLFNTPKMPFKPHLFHCNGNIYNDWP